MDDIDITNDTLQRAGWGTALPKTNKQILTCPACGQMAIYMNQQLQCVDLCHHFHAQDLRTQNVHAQANPQNISMEQ